MKTVGIREAKNLLSEIADASQEASVLVTRRGRPSFLMVGVERMDPEDVHWGTDEKLWAQIERGRRETNRISHDDLMAELGIADETR